MPLLAVPFRWEFCLGRYSSVSTPSKCTLILGQNRRGKVCLCHSLGA